MQRIWSLLPTWATKWSLVLAWLDIAMRGKKSGATLRCPPGIRPVSASRRRLADSVPTTSRARSTMSGFWRGASTLPESAR